MNDLVEFLNRCNDEDEAAARACFEDVGISADDWRVGRRTDGAVYIVDGYGDGVIQKVTAESADEGSIGEHIALHDPARVLRECEARRRLIEIAKHKFRRADNHRQFTAGTYEHGEADSYVEALRLSAQSYVYRPGFREEWRVS